MKLTRRLALLLCAALLFAFPVAAEAESGFYGVAASERVQIVPLAADGSAVAGESRDVDGSGRKTVFYPASRSLRVTVSDAAPEAWYLLTVSAGDVVLYADQKIGSAPLVFDVAFSLPLQRTDLLLAVGSNAQGFERISVPLSYTPAAAAKRPAPSAPSVVQVIIADAPCPKDASCPLASFTDLDPAAWYHDGVHYCMENGMMNGVGEGKFDPDGATSRAMLVTILWRMEGAPVVNYAMAFADVPADAWYAEAVRWAAAQHVVEGCGDGTFRPDAEITREQLAAILYRLAQAKGQGFTGAWQFKLDQPDASAVSGWADEAMHWCVMNEIINGKDGCLVPGGSASRAEAAAMLMRFCTKA